MRMECDQMANSIGRQMSIWPSQPAAEPEVQNPQRHNGSRYDHPILQMETRNRDFTDKPMSNAFLHKKIFYRYFIPMPALKSSEFSLCAVPRALQIRRHRNFSFWCGRIVQAQQHLPPQILVCLQIDFRSSGHSRSICAERCKPKRRVNI
jgi:hypothetical protein